MRTAGATTKNARCGPTLPQLCGLLLTLCCLHTQAAQSTQNPAAAKEELQQLRSRIEALQKDMAGAESSRGEAADQLREAERAISDANRELSQIDLSLAEANKRIESARGESTKTTEALEARQRVLAKLLHQQYLKHGTGRPEVLRVLLSGENPSAMVRDLQYAAYVSRAHGEVIRGMRDNLTQLKTLSGEATAKAAEIVKLGAEQLNQRKRLENERTQRAGLMNKLAQDIRRQRNEISVMQRNESRLTSLIEQLARLIERTPPRRNPSPESGDPAKPPRAKTDRVPEPTTVAGLFSKLRGRLALPVRGELAARFGSPRIDGGPPFKGLLVAATAGSQVRAVAAGRVVYADWLRGFGNLLIVDHGEGYMSLYGYNESLLKQVGDDVGGGETVATVGNSGGSGESGLYFELRHQGRPFDPLTWVGR